MKLKDFLDMWTRKNLTVMLCDADDYDEMFDLVDDINDGKTKVSDIQQYLICAFLPHYCQFTEKYYISMRWMNAEVENFYVGTTAMLIWIRDNEESHPC